MKRVNRLSYHERRDVTQHIIILTQLPFRRRDYDRFGIEILSRDFQVKVLDCSAWLEPSYWEKYAEVRHEFPGYVSVKDWAHFIEQIAAMTGASIAIDYLFHGTAPRQIRKEFRKRNIPRTMVFSSVLPRVEAHGLANIKTVLRAVRDAGRRTLNRLRRLMAPNLAPGMAADIAILSGEASQKEANAQGAHQVWAHAFDYDTYLAHSANRAAPTSPYAVFLDQNLVYHPDLLFTGTAAASTKEIYYPALNQFFDRFERLTGYRVVIAAHPRSRYDLRPYLLGGREIVLGKTAELVRDANLVFAHYSESISFAVLWRKPMVFLTSDDMQKIWIRPYIQLLAGLLNSTIININAAQDADISLPQWLDIAERNYDQYERNYIKRPGTPKRPLWEIFSDYARNQLGRFQ